MTVLCTHSEAKLKLSSEAINISVNFPIYSNFLLFDVDFQVHCHHCHISFILKAIISIKD